MTLEQSAARSQTAGHNTADSGSCGPSTGPSRKASAVLFGLLYYRVAQKSKPLSRIVIKS